MCLFLLSESHHCLSFFILISKSRLYFYRWASFLSRLLEMLHCNLSMQSKKHPQLSDNTQYEAFYIYLTKKILNLSP